MPDDAPGLWGQMYVDDDPLIEAGQHLARYRAAKLAREITELIDQRTRDEHLATAALWRCLALYIVREHSGDDAPELAAMALLEAAAPAARLAERLAREKGRPKTDVNSEEAQP